MFIICQLSSVVEETLRRVTGLWFSEGVTPDWRLTQPEGLGTGRPSENKSWHEEKSTFSLRLPDIELRGLNNKSEFQLLC